jgi:hypothetical protein
VRHCSNVSRAPFEPARVPFTSAKRASGSLSVLPPRVLFEAAEATGADLRLTMREPATGGLLIMTFRGGRPTMVLTPGDGRSLGELLLAAGRIDRSTLTDLLERRLLEGGSLESLLAERTRLGREELQRFFDFQARQRVLDALVWTGGTFEVEEYRGDAEAAFQVGLPSFESLALRADTRARALPELLKSLPAPPNHVLVRRRRGVAEPEGAVERRLLSVLDQPLLVPQLIGRLLEDDDLVLRGLISLAERRAVALAPRAALVAVAGEGREERPFSAELLREVVHLLSGNGEAGGHAAVWLLVVGDLGDAAASFVRRLGATAGAADAEGGVSPVSHLLGSIIRLAPDVSLCVLAVRPAGVSPAAIDALLSRCDAVCVVRAAELEASERWPSNVSEVIERASRRGRVPLLGVDLAAAGRPWKVSLPVILGVPGWQERGPDWLLDRIVTGLHAAVTSRAGE